MADQIRSFNDYAIVIAWPDQTARGDEAWMALLKRAGIVKNLNFKIGHAAIVLVNHYTGALSYYDFGRYITPRGYGRVRSAGTDPRLTLHTRAVLSKTGEISNLAAIAAELKSKEEATHGGGRMFFSVIDRLSCSMGAAFAASLIREGVVRYGALAPGNSSCSRFVAQTLLVALQIRHPSRKFLLFPETIKASPMSNVVNASLKRQIYCYDQGELRQWSMNRFRSLLFQTRLLTENLRHASAANLPDDSYPGSLEEPVRPAHLPTQAQWLGGIGEGAWFSLTRHSEQVYLITRYNSCGLVDYEVAGTADRSFFVDLPYAFTYYCRADKHQILQNDRLLYINTIQQPEIPSPDLPAPSIADHELYDNNNIS